MNEKEEWRWVPEYEGRYKVSSEGRVKSFLFNRSGKLMKLEVSRNGYARVHFQWKKTWLVHRLVAVTFIPNPDRLPSVNHRDGVKSNNSVSNLQWMTYSDNMKHSWRDLQTYRNRVAKAPRGEDSPVAKLTRDKVLSIRQMYAGGGYSQREIAEQFGVSKQNIQAIVSRRNWAHV